MSWRCPVVQVEMFTVVSLQIGKRFPSFISVFHKTLMLDLCPAPSFIVIFPCLFSIFTSPPFGPLWQSMSALLHAHPYMDEHCFSVSKGQPLTEKRRGHGHPSGRDGSALCHTTSHYPRKAATN